MASKFNQYHCINIAFSLLFGVMLVLSVMTTSCFAADIEQGQKIYQKRCRSCHLIDSETNRLGPHLKNIINRPAGSIAHYNYSPAMTEAGQKNLVWNEESLRAFVMDPKALVPGTKMRFWGLWSSEVDDLIAFLKAQD